MDFFLSLKWVALSVYFKGLPAHWPWRQNEIAPPSFASDLITGGPFGGNIPFNVYNMFAAAKGKPFAVSCYFIFLSVVLTQYFLK